MRRVFCVIILLAALVVPTLTTVNAGNRADLARANNKLVNTIISDVHYENADLEDVIKEISNTAGVSIIVSKAVKAEGYSVNLELSSVKAYNLINIVLGDHDLKLMFGHGVYFVRTKLEAKQRARTTTRVYDIRDIAMKVKNFKAPKIGLVGSDGKTSVDYESDDDDDEDDTPTAEDITDLIQTHVEPDVWGAGKHRLAEFKGQLVVTTSSDIHRKVALFLNKLRAAR